MPLRIELFGNLRILRGAEPVAALNTSRLQSLLAYLVLHAEAPQSREQLAFLLWPESSESQARTNLRQLLHHLRRALPGENSPLLSDNHTVQWRRDSECWVDALEFDAAISRGAWEEAAQLYQDDLLRGLYDEWLQPVRERYRQQFAEVLSRIAGQCEERRDYAA